MPNITIHDNDAEALINAFEGINARQEIDLSDDPMLRYALANLIGALRTQADAETYNPSPGIHKRVNLDFLMGVMSVNQMETLKCILTRIFHSP